MDTLSELFQDQLQDLYSAEKQLTKALAAMARKASTPSLKEAFTGHLEETNNQVQRLEEISRALEISIKGKVCKAMEGLIEEGKEIIKKKGDRLVLDAALIAAAQRIEHYEISAYGSARALAGRLRHTDAVDLLQVTLDEEAGADEKLNSISLDEVLVEAPSEVEEVEDEEDEDQEEAEEEPATPSKKATPVKKGK
jgi:ferritin-like metal-binding protein YciE